MREDIPHPDKRTSLRVVLESSPVHSRGFSRSRKGLTPSSLPGASRDGLGLTVVSLPCPKGCIFWCESWGRERTQNIRKAAGVDNGLRRQKKHPPPMSQKVDIFISPWYTMYAEGRWGFYTWPLRTTYHFSRLRGLRVFMNFPAKVLLCFPSSPSSIVCQKETTSQKVDIRRLRWYNKITKSIRGVRSRKEGRNEL